MKKSFPLTQILITALVITIAAFVRSAIVNKQLRADLERQTENVSCLNYSIQYDKLDDSIPVAKNTALQAKVSELEQLHLTDTKLIKKLKIKLKDVQSIHTTASTTADTVCLTQEPSTIPGISDSIYTYKDKWLSLHIDIPKRTCQYACHDSLTTIVSRTYKHRFLWWRWGTKGYQVQIVNHNPHSHIDYSRYIEVVK